MHQRVPFKCVNDFVLEAHPKMSKLESSAIDLDLIRDYFELIILPFAKHLLCYSLQTTDDARRLLKYLDEDLGKPLPEQSYGEDCRLYTPGHPKGSFYTFLVGCIVIYVSFSLHS